MKYSFTADSSLNGMRADIAAAKRLNISRSSFQSRLREDSLSVNGKKRPVSYKIQTGDQIEFEWVQPQVLSLRPQDIPLNILFEDEWMLIISKQAGLVTHPGGGSSENTVVNAFLHHLKGQNKFDDKVRPGIVHRLDKDTSGIMVIAKTPQSLERLQTQFAQRCIEKEYRAIVTGNIKEATLTITAGIGRHLTDRKKMAVLVPRSKEAITEVNVLERFTTHTYVSVHPKTGRTHQIRVHFSYWKHPILGDKTYGGKNNLNIFKHPLRRQMLHAYKIRLNHPATNQSMEFTAPIPQDMEEILQLLRGR
ncbi:MAG: RluA family pseudouridine synthase [Candidatus Aureabacteria bacterium]|nr:RluA family pseudouridine synthase [Candidatus Auribacterota bacterium]